MESPSVPGTVNSPALPDAAASDGFLLC
ncbi:hypothetical protein CIB84_017018 [Bambusicola thoracicus]|uniref:Uncharacterized protein n=1 Tax=Bambusicola thoracicus TaxID=9083 RepID=A0A2P4S5B8_BAMTH|nr:hypothetical protein CIB84_017018 [Bambusicola thoracicus]